MKIIVFSISKNLMGLSIYLAYRVGNIFWRFYFLSSLFLTLNYEEISGKNNDEFILKFISLIVFILKFQLKIK